MTLRGAIATILTLTAVGTATAANDQLRGEMLGVLTHARVSIDFEEVPVREALDRVGSALGLTIIGRYEDDAVGHGIDPMMPITLRLDSVVARDALEMIIDQATLYASCTWQLRTGFIEIGTKRRLGYATERRVYPMADLLMEPPYFLAPGALPPDVQHFNRHPYRSASLKIGNFKTRYGAHDLVEELVRAIAEIVEPGNWDFELSRPPPTSPAKQTFGPYRSDDHRIARIRQSPDGQLIIVAPDYFHRQIGGSGRAIMPTIESLNDRAVPQPGVTVVGLDTRARSSSILADIVQPAAAAEDDDDNGPPIIRGSMVGQAFYEHAVRTLLERQISFSFNETPAREALAEVQSQLGLPVIGRFADDELGYGIDPKLPITLLLDDVPAIDGLETLLEQCGMLGEACTWQIRRGYIEVGTKKRLSVPAARTLRLYYIRDLMLDIHDFTERPKTQLGVALDQIDTIVNTIEPEAWDWGQVEYYQADDERVVRSHNDRPASGEGDDDVSPADRPRPEYVEPLRPATIRHWRDVLIVLAPDYIHRQLGGLKPR